MLSAILFIMFVAAAIAAAFAFRQWDDAKAELAGMSCTAASYEAECVRLREESQYQSTQADEARKHYHAEHADHAATRTALMEANQEIAELENIRNILREDNTKLRDKLKQAVIWSRQVEPLVPRVADLEVVDG